MSIDVRAAYDAHVDFVWRLLLRPGVHPAHAEDAAHEVFLVLHRRRDEFRGASNLRTWLGGIAVRVASDHRRGAARARNNVAELRRLPPRPQPGPHQHAEEREAFALVLELLDQLPDEQRTTFVRPEFEELTLREISGMTGMNANTVASRLRLARRRFEELLTRSRREETAS